MRTRCAVLTLALLLTSAAFAAEGGDAPAPEIRKIPITIYPNRVIVVKGKMVEMEKLKEHLAALVPDAKKPGVEVTVYPESKKEMDLVGDVVRIAKEAGYTNVTFESPKEKKELPAEIVVLVSKTGAILVDEVSVKEADLQAHLEKKLAAEDRPKVRVYVRATRLVSMKKVRDVIKICKDAGYTDTVFGLIAE
jgi:biopolymer transport protein ExbD